MSSFIPLNPGRGGRNNGVATLAAATSPTPSPKDLKNFSVYYDSISLSLAASLKVSPIFEGSFDAKDAGFYFDAVQYTDVPAAPGESGPNGMQLDSVRFGIGLRLAVRVRNLDSKVGVNFSVISSQVEAGYASARYDMQVYGLGVQGMALVLNTIPNLLGDFKFETFYLINRDLVKAVGNYVKDEMAKASPDLTPQRIGATVKSSAEAEELRIGRGVYFAMRWISERKPLGDAKRMPQAASFDADVLSRVYNHVIGGNVGDGDQISREAERYAEEWLQSKF